MHLRSYPYVDAVEFLTFPHNPYGIALVKKESAISASDLKRKFSAICKVDYSYQDKRRICRRVKLKGFATYLQHTPALGPLQSDLLFHQLYGGIRGLSGIFGGLGLPLNLPQRYIRSQYTQCTYDYERPIGPFNPCMGFWRFLAGDLALRMRIS